MRRLVTLIVACLAMPVCMYAQTMQDFASRFMDDNAGDKNLECVTVGPKMLREITKMAKENDDSQDMMSFFSNINSVRIINSGSSAEEYRKEALELLESSSKRYTKYGKGDSSEDYGDCVWVRRRSDKIVELVYVSMAKEKEFMVLDITGQLDEDFVDSLLNNSKKH